MTQTKTKKALLMSVLSMVLCVAMLVGMTFAWFTDTASTSVNKIQAGKLDVLLEMATAWDNEGNPTAWKPAEGKKLQFKVNGEIPAEGTQILWEPGCTYELPELRITNDGNLALKYKVVISGIDGDAELNNVIDWTMNLGGKSYVLGEARSLAAKTATSTASDILTISGHMQETAGNKYMEKEIDGISITVYATQDTVESDSFGNTYDQNADGTPQYDTWYDNVSATGTVTAGEATVIKDKEINPTITVTAPAGSTNAEKLTLTKNKTNTPANITVETGTKTLSAEIKLVDQDGNKVTAKNGKFFTLTMPIGIGLNVIGFYHNTTALTAVDSAEAVAAANDCYYYDATTGDLTFSTDDFSPFTVVTSDSEFNGGDGTEPHPYLIATGDQAYKMRNAKGYFKLIDDVVVTNEVYLSGKTYTLDLNGHSIKLEYADGVKPNNGGVLNIAGKGGKLTVNDSSEAQTGKVIGSDKTYANKVTSAVRVGNYGKLTINGGHFYGMSEGTSCIFTMTARSSGSKATVVINGGTFETASASNGTYFVLNHQDSATAGCTMTVNGGKFKNYNPGVTVVDPVNAYTGKIVLGPGCTTTSKVIDGATWHTVSK